MKRAGTAAARILTIPLATVLLAGTVVPSTASAAEFRAGEETVTVPAGQTIEDDLYIAGQTVTITGAVNGDLVAAGSTVTIDGTVTGSVWVLGGTVTINGNVGHSVRVGAGTVVVNGTVGADVLAGAGEVTVAQGATVGRDLAVGSGTLTQNAVIGRNLKAGAEQITIAGEVKGSITAATGRGFTLAPTAVVGGTIDYSGPEELSREEGAQVGGTIDYTRTDPSQAQRNTLAERIAGQLYWFLAALLLLIAILLYARRAAVRGAALIGERPGGTVLAGLAFLVLVPVVGFILLITLVGLPLSIITFFGYGLVLYTAKLFPALAVGQALLLRGQRKDLFWPTFGAGALGLALFYLLAALPGIGWLVSLAALLFGTGAQLFLFREVYGAVRKKYGA